MNGELHILLVEDRPPDAELVTRELRRSGLQFALRRVDNEEDFRRALREATPDLVLSDLSLPVFHGTEALAILKEQFPEAPLIFVSGTVGEETAVDLLKLGATDYVLKQHLSRLPAAVERALREVRLKRESRQAEERYRSIFENASVGIYQVCPKGRFLAVNPTLARLHGYSSAAEMQALVENSKQLFVDAQRFADLSALMEATGEVQNFEAEQFRRDGSRFWVSLHARVGRDARGQPHLYEGFVVDVTRRRDLEAQMLRAQRMESIGTLASGVAHDLNNIIAPILMSVSLLHRDMPADERERILSIMEKSARRGAQIVKQVLAFGRGVEGERHPLEIGVLVRDVLKILYETFPKNITVDNTIGRDLWPVVGDATQIHQVFLNLCVNARDAMPEGGNLSIRARNLTVDESYSSMLPQVVPGQYALIEVTDTGEGMSLEVTQRIFDPFFTTKGIGKGTGLGLSTVLGIVKSHGGFVNAVSEPRRGATFNVYLPAIPGLVAAKDSADPAAAPPEGKGELILVVDDEEMICNAARNVLEVHGYRVLTARDGTEALAVFAQNQSAVAVVLTDLMMPFMDGVALTRALRRMDPRVFIVASTGLGERTRLSELESMNVRAVLDKPYDAETLLRTVHAGLHPAPPTGVAEART